MNQERLMKVILAPIVSEKSNMLAEKRNQMVFKVLKDATKTEIKAAVELLFNVQVASVTTTTTKGKTKRFGRTLGRRSDVKKAYVSLVAGQELDLEAAAAAADKE
ncbi:MULTISPECIES: 50S ribosomal protein L23 [Neisseriaceae]|uniref:Large ribosomal subunit protein uL23 n=1 Tax=Alysiella filiformis DSM 16848 TaxID=1120981 RepID=A0A286EEW0_9NEIS|nr:MULTISPECIES: 50S ribosomal protein L23 [Neisseriaceae]MCG7656044.1 50S ribosomal protein L23 [Wielerella bovis]MCG7658270.1 50S ribosomal protein L23 [Wielerella bovis]MDO4433693.1 50S ribosomal protein L23 [Alysiella sp.]QMT31840.1 50S ribosomal protein L23 [Alysiella filiformis]UBQ57255.1 50S ribosomal protein L23 [Alysiella filiformis DSM 16848]